jgi:CSLREA domain-containing protein
MWLLTIAFLSSAAAVSVPAATFTVNDAGDAGDGTCDANCTLRDAVDDANNLASNDTIVFAPHLTTITLTN